MSIFRMLLDALAIQPNHKDVGEFPEDYNETEKRIAEMLTENTGIHPLDSGFYGRWWQKNRGRDFKRERPAWIKGDDDMYWFEISTFHFLNAFLELDDNAKALQVAFELFSELPENREKSWLSCMEGFARVLQEDADNWKYEFTENTYNFDNFLQQGLQYVVLSTYSDDDDEEEYYILLQIHNGADIRGGYTKPQAFRLYPGDEFVYWYDAMKFVEVSCSNCDEWIYTYLGDIDWYGHDGEIVDPSEFMIVKDDRAYHRKCKNELDVLPHYTILDAMD